MLNSVDDESANLRTKKDNGTFTTCYAILEGENIMLASGREEGGVPIELYIDTQAHLEAAAHAQNAMNGGVSGEGVIDRAVENSEINKVLSYEIVLYSKHCRSPILSLLPGYFFYF
ncbi:hypothetical protein ACX0G9_25950 [Flavitalea flava]